MISQTLHVRSLKNFVIYFPDSPDVCGESAAAGVVFYGMKHEVMKIRHVLCKYYTQTTPTQNTCGSGAPAFSRLFSVGKKGGELPPPSSSGGSLSPVLLAWVPKHCDATL